MECDILPTMLDSTFHSQDFQTMIYKTITLENINKCPIGKNV